MPELRSPAAGGGSSDYVRSLGCRPAGSSRPFPRDLAVYPPGVGALEALASLSSGFAPRSRGRYPATEPALGRRTGAGARRPVT